MSRLKTFVPSVLLVLLASPGLWGQTQGRLFLFPSGSGSNITVLDATTMATVGAIPTPPNASHVVGLPDGSKYYIIANNAANTVTIVNGSNLTVTGQKSLGANASAGVITPDGRRLLVTAGNLRIFDTSNDQEVGSVPCGTGPTDIEVSHDSTRAFVMSASSGLVTVVNLTTNQQAAQYPIPGPLSLALMPSGLRLLVLAPNGLNLLQPNTGNIEKTIPVLVTFGRVMVTPDSSKAVILNRGFGPSDSQIVDLANYTVATIGAGNIAFEQLVVADNTTAFGIVSVTNPPPSTTVARIDLTTGSPTVQTYGANSRAMDVAPSGRFLYLASFQGSNATRVDVSANLATGTQNVSNPPTALSAVILPAAANASAMILNGGDRQNVLAGQSTPFPLSVRVTTADGTPVFNHPVTFATSATGVTITPTQPSRTNTKGVALANVSVAAASTLQNEPEGGELPAEAAASSEPARDAEKVEQGVQTIAITANAPGTPGVNFTLSIGTSTGLVAVSGGNQITRPQQPFPLPLVVRVTGTDGFPLPAGTLVSFFTTGAGVFPPFIAAPTDGDGIARAQFTGGTMPPGFTSFTTLVNASVDGKPELGTVSFFLITAFSVPAGVDVLSGDGQSGDVGSTLPFPLCVQVGSGGAFTPVGNIGVYWEVLDGPAGSSSASLNPPISLTGPGGQSCTQLTIGPRAGTQPIVVKATVPGVVGEARFNQIRATGGPPARVTITQGDNQEGRPGQTLPVALRVRVFDLFGNPVRLPNNNFPLTFNMDPFAAGAISNFFQQEDGEASALVTIALNYVGTFRVVAAAGNGSATFNFRSVAQPAALARVSGQDQTVGVGGTTAQPLIARVADTNGGPVPSVPVTFRGPSSVTFVPTSGPPGNPITVNSGTDGRVSVSVRVSAGTAPGTITITASTTVGDVTYNLTVTGRTPSFTAAAVVNAASSVPGMVPGGLATVFGTGLSEVTGIESPGGATTHRGVQVRIDGQAMPLFAVANVGGQEQINFQVRTDVPGPSTVRVEVSNNGATFSVSNVPVLRAQPGIFEYTPAGSAVKHAAALKTDGSVIGPNNRAARGSAVQLYLTGGGPSLPLLPTGQAAPSSPLATLFFQPTVGVAGRGARVLFAGLAPGFIGLVQINIVIPDDAPVGEAVALDVIIEGVASQTTRIAIQ